MNVKVHILGDCGDPERSFTETDDYVGEAIACVVAKTADRYISAISANSTQVVMIAQPGWAASSSGRS